MNRTASGRQERPDLEVFTWVYPRRSSDSVIAVEAPNAGSLAAWYGVADMIGKPERRGWGKYMRTVERRLRQRLRADPPGDAATHHALLKRVLQEHNRWVYDIRSRHDESAFGFCVCFASVFHTSCRIFGLGDCRAYRIRRIPRPAPRGPAFDVKALTRDHNALDRFLREREKKAVFFHNELLDLSKRLELFLGIGDHPRLAEQLTDPNTEIELEPDTCLLLVTDGFSLPLIRDVLAVSEGLGLDDFYLENWLARLLEREADGRDSGSEPDWPTWTEGLIAEVLRAADRRPEYRDDIALLGLYRPSYEQTKCRA